MNTSGIFYILGWILFILAGAMLVPALTSVVYSDAPRLPEAVGLPEGAVGWVFTIMATAVAFVGGALILGMRGRERLETRQQGLVLLVLIWFTVPIVAAVPILVSGAVPTPFAAFFEAVSGFTTTGATVFGELKGVAKGLIMWRAVLQWLGGLATLLGLALVIGPLAGLGTIERQLRLLGTGERGRAWYQVSAIRTILPFYAALTAACFLLLIVGGLPVFDALCISMSTVSTGGFLPRDGTIILYGSTFALFVVGVFMLASAVSIVWLRSLINLRFSELKHSREPFVIASVCVLLALPLIAAFNVEMPEFSWDEELRGLAAGFATAASFVSTTGFAISPATDDALPLLIVLFLCVVGGGRFSTAGGLKFFRLGALLQQSGQELNRLIYPNSVPGLGGRFSTAASRSRTGDERNIILRAVWANFAVLCAAICVLSGIMGWVGLDLPAALLASISAISNIGPAYTLMADGVGGKFVPYGDLNALGHFSLSVGMILGRVEILALLGLFNFAYWRS